MFTREQIAGSVEEAERWRDLEIEPEGLLRPLEDLAILTYRTGARRGEGERYLALISSGYARRDGTWKLVFHQQTPVKA